MNPWNNELPCMLLSVCQPPSSILHPGKKYQNQWHFSCAQITGHCQLFLQHTQRNMYSRALIQPPPPSFASLFNPRLEASVFRFILRLYTLFNACLFLCLQPRTTFETTHFNVAVLEKCQSLLLNIKSKTRGLWPDRQMTGIGRGVQSDSWHSWDCVQHQRG